MRKVGGIARARWELVAGEIFCTASGMRELAIATITLARTASEERTLRRSLSILAEMGWPVIAADGGSRESFQAFLVKSGFTVVHARGGLVHQVKAALQTATQKNVLYTEPDKIPFFTHGLEAFAKLSGKAPLHFAARSPRAFSTFPSGQQHCEKFMNQATETMTRLHGDFCYGPLLLDRTAIAAALESPEHLGWGWRFWTLGRMVRAKKRVLVTKREFSLSDGSTR